MSNECCGACRYWASADDPEEYLRFGSCRRYAPRPEYAHDNVRWPGTNNQQWCGEFEPEKQEPSSEEY